MVMIFQSDRVRKFLLEKGYVYTVRRRRHIEFGRDWATDRRGGRKIADISVTKFDVIPRQGLLKCLEPLVPDSGFNTVTEWVEEIRRRLHTRKVDKFYVYRVDVVK